MGGKERNLDHTGDLDGKTLGKEVGNHTVNTGVGTHPPTERPARSQSEAVVHRDRQPLHPVQEQLCGEFTRDVRPGPR